MAAPVCSSSSSSSAISSVTPVPQASASKPGLASRILNGFTSAASYVSRSFTATHRAEPSNHHETESDLDDFDMNEPDCIFQYTVLSPLDVNHSVSIRIDAVNPETEHFDKHKLEQIAKFWEYINSMIDLVNCEKKEIQVNLLGRISSETSYVGAEGKGKYRDRVFNIKLNMHRHFTYDTTPGKEYLTSMTNYCITRLA